MPSVEIITIGTEILLGEILDTNAQHLAITLRQSGLDLYRKTTVGDNVDRIAAAVREALNRADIIITTGGLGPTVDDPTRQAIAAAVGVETEYRPELWEQIQARFRRFDRKPTENNRRQAYVPVGAIAVENLVGTAPAFVVEVGEKSIFSLPGVPHEMEYLLEHAVLPYIRQRYLLDSVILSRVLHTSGAGESQIDDLIGDLEEASNPTVGLAAHTGQVDVRITAKAGSQAEAQAIIAPVEETLRQRLGKWIYGADQDTLEETALRNLEQHNWQLCVLEAGLGGELTRRLTTQDGPASSAFVCGEVVASPPEPSELLERTRQLHSGKSCQMALGAALHVGPEKADLHVALITPQGEEQATRSYGGHPSLAQTWSINFCLDRLRNI